MRFTKMHGLGNDYLYHYGEIEKPADVSIKLSERHFGIGSDGIILITPSDCADFKMRIFNADGSEAKMCGNGIRCVGKYVFDKGYTDKTHLTVETLSGIKTLDLKTVGGKAVYATVDMGKCKVNKSVTLEALNREITLLPVSMGNPHAVFFIKDAERFDVAGFGSKVETHPMFPQRTNVEFAEVLAPDLIRMRVWERGAGITDACGTGACATLTAAVRRGLSAQKAEIRMDGGSLWIEWKDKTDILMTGKTHCAFTGTYNA